MRHSIAQLLSGIITLALFTGTAMPALAQGNPSTGIAISVADWLEPWEPNGGWFAATAGATLEKMPVPVAESTQRMAPGTYDVFWVQRDGAAPMLVSSDILVADGLTDVRIATGAVLETADWVQLRVVESGWFGAIVNAAEEFNLVNWTPDRDAIVLPLGRYDFFYEVDETDDDAPIWLGTYSIEPVFGGLGIEVAMEDADLVIVRLLPGGGAEAAGLRPGDIILAADGTVLAGMDLADAVAVMRGPAGTQAVLSVSRGKSEAEISFARTRVEPRRIIAANNGIQLMAVGTSFGPTGYWGVVFAGDDVAAFADLIAARTSGSLEPLLLGPTSYDLYWNPDGIGPPELVAADIAMNGTLMEIDTPSE
jgi:hypothetical protein